MKIKKSPNGGKKSPNREEKFATLNVVIDITNKLIWRNHL